MSTTLRLGTRGSALARWQAEWVATTLVNRGFQVELVPIVTQGDEQTSQPIGNLGAQGVFTKEIQRALVAGRIDLAVHSLKDLPTEPVPGVVLAAVPPRESTADVLVSRNGFPLSGLPRGSRVGTGSLRRRAQLRHVRRDLEMVDLRGNLDTRLRKLDLGQCDAIVLAEAGLKRLGWADRVTEVLPQDIMLPAVGQGALGVECRVEDEAAFGAARTLDDRPTHLAVLAERAMLAALLGGCLAPVGAVATVAQPGQLLLVAVVLSGDGQQRLAAQMQAPDEQAEALGRAVAAQLLADGAGVLIAAARAG